MQGVKHIFLTGETQSGKSSLIEIILSKHPDWRVGGFRTVTSTASLGENDRGVYLLPAGKPDAPCGPANLVGIRHGEGRRTAVPAAFDSIGVELLQHCAGADLIVMDELGTMENEALLFLHQVQTVLDGDTPVLGVLKKKNTPFLEGIRQRGDVRILEVSFQSFEDCLAAADIFLCSAVGQAHDRLK